MNKDNKEYYKKDFFKKDPYKPKPWENKPYIFPEEKNKDFINKLYTNFLTTGYDEILAEINKNNILNFKNDEGKTLIIAVLENTDLSELQKKQIIEKLIHHKVSINAFDKFNRTSLHRCCEMGYNSIIQLLIDKKVLKNELDNDGNAPVHYYIEHFVKDCNDYDVYNTKRNDIINPKEQKYADIINSIFNNEIFDFLKNTVEYKKIKELLRLIKYFEINKINDEYDIFKKDIEFKIEDDIIDSDRKNKMFKNFIKFKNNVSKIYEDYNNITYYKEEDFDKLLDQEKDNIVDNLKKYQKKNVEEFYNVKKFINEMKESFGNIAESLLLLIYFKKNFKFTVFTYKIDFANNITKSCNNIKTIILNSLQNESAKDYTADIVSSISTDNSTADTHIKDIFKFKEDFDTEMNKIKILLENLKSAKAAEKKNKTVFTTGFVLNLKQVLNLRINNLKTTTENNSVNTDGILFNMINNIDNIVKTSEASTDLAISNILSTIKTESINFSDEINYNIKHRKAIRINPIDTNIYLPLQIASQAAGSALLYDAAYYVLTPTTPNLFIERDPSNIKNGAEISLKSASSSIYNYIKAYKQSIKANFPNAVSSLTPADRNTFISLAAKKDILLNIFCPPLPPAPAPPPHLQQDALNQYLYDDSWINGIIRDLEHLDISYTNTIIGNNNQRTFDPTRINNPINLLQNRRMNSVIREINRSCFNNAIANQISTKNYRTPITIFSVNSLIRRLLNRPSIRGINISNDTDKFHLNKYLSNATIGAIAAEKSLVDALAAGALAQANFITAIQTGTNFSIQTAAIVNSNNAAIGAAFAAAPDNNASANLLLIVGQFFTAANQNINIFIRAAAVSAVIMCSNYSAPLPTIFSLEEAIIIGVSVATAYNAQVLNFNIIQIVAGAGGLGAVATASHPFRVQIATAVINHILKPGPAGGPPFIFNNTATPTTISNIARQAAINIAAFPQASINEFTHTMAATLSFFPKTTDIIYRIESEINILNNAALPRITNINAAEIVNIQTTKTTYDQSITSAITFFNEIIALIPPAVCTIPIAPLAAVQNEWNRVNNLNNFLVPDKFIGIPAAGAQPTFDIATAVSNGYSDATDLYKEIRTIIKDLKGVGVPILQELKNVKKKAKQLVEAIAVVNLNKAEILEIFAERLYNNIQAMTNSSSEDCRDYALNLLILSIFINDRQIDKPLDYSYQDKFTQVTASLNNFYTSSINCYVNSLNSKIFYIKVMNDKPPLANPQLPPIFFKEVIDSIIQINKKKINSGIINGFETNMNKAIATITRNLYNNMRVTIAPAAEGVNSQPLQISSLSVALVFGLEEGSFLTAPLGNLNKSKLRDCLFFYLNGLNKTIVNRFNIIQPIYEIILDSQKKKIVLDKIKSEIQVLPAELSKIQVQQGNLSNIDPKQFNKDFKDFKDKIFTSEGFNYTLNELDISSIIFNNNSVVYYDSQKRILVKTFIPDDSCQNEYNNTKSCDEQYLDATIADRYCKIEYDKTNYRTEYLFNNIQSQTILKNGIFYLDSNNDRYVNFYDDDIDELSFNYKFLNVHFIFELLEKYLEDIENIDLPKEADENYFDNINVKTIFKIYSNYDKIICILNNLLVISKKYTDINDKLDVLKEKFGELKDPRETPFFNYRLTSPKDVATTVPPVSVAAKKKKYKIDQHGGFDNYVDIFTKRIDERILELDKKINSSTFNIIYDLLKTIMENYNKVIEIIDKKYSLQFYNFMKTNTQPSLQLQYYNRFMKLNDKEFPANIKLYFSNFFDSKGDIKLKEISKLFLKLNDINYNEIYNNVAPKLYIEDYVINPPYTKDKLRYDRNRDKIYFDSNVISQLFENKIDFINGTDNNIIIYDNNNFNLGYFLQNNFDDTKNKDKIYMSLFDKLCALNREFKLGKYIYHNKIFVNRDDLIILVVYYYNIYFNHFMNECKKKYLQDIEGHFTSVRCIFEDKFSRKDRESKKIIKNFNRIIQNIENAKEFLENKFNTLLKILLDTQIKNELDSVMKMIFKNTSEGLRKIVERYSEVPEKIIDKLKEINTIGKIYLIDPTNNVNDNKVYSTKIINKVCLNKKSLDKIRDFNFDLRFPDKNGNTVIHRLVDQLNDDGIKKLLDYNKSIVTYKNYNNQTPTQYLVDIFNIITNSYKKEEVEKKIDDLVSKIHEDFNKDNIILWTDKDTSVIYSNSLIQFNEFLWLNLYHFKNNISMTDIKILKTYLSKNKSIKENLLMREIDDTIVKKKLDIIFGNDIKKKLLENFETKACEEIADLNNTLKNLENLNQGLPQIFNQAEIAAEIAEIKKKINKIENRNKDVNNFIKIFNNKQQKSVEEIICYFSDFKSKFIKATDINFEELMEFAKLIDKDYFKILHLLFDFKKEQNNLLFMCDFNYELIAFNITELDKDITIQEAYKNYFYKHIETIVDDFFDLDKYEDYTVNYVNQVILKIININMVFTISWEIYNTLLQYIFEKYDASQLENINKNNRKQNDSRLVIKNIKLYLKNKLYEILEIKNPIKSYDSIEVYKDVIINFFIDFAGKKLEEEDKKKIEQILEYYTKILQTIANRFYNDIKVYLTDQRKIIILLKIYERLKNCEKEVYSDN
jgi:hypothetical protein